MDTKSAAAERLEAYEHIRELARGRLIDLEDVLKQKKLRSRCGIEVEFFVNDQKDKPQALRKKDFDRISDMLTQSRYGERFYQEGQRFNHTPSIMGAIGTAIAMVDGDISSVPCFMAMGAGMGALIQRYVNGTFRKVAQYEFVLGDGENASRMNCFKAAVAAEHMKWVISQELKHIGDVTYKARPRRDRVVSGMHINMSVMDKEGNNLFADPHSLLMEDTARHLVTLQQEGALLFLPDEAALERLAGRSAPKEFGITHNKQVAHNNLSRSVDIRKPSRRADLINWGETGPEHSRVENRLPGADADPYLSMIITLDALIETLEQTWSPALKNLPLHATFEDQVKAFGTSKRVKEALGEKLHGAIAEYVDRYGDLAPPPELSVDPLSKMFYPETHR